MAFNSMSELERYLMSRCYKSVIAMQNHIHNLIHSFLREFYHEFTPEVYDRTYELFNSLIKQDIIQTPNGFEAVVYFDVNSMNHVKSTMSEEEIMKTAMIGEFPHGGYAPAGGVGIWTKVLEDFKKNNVYEQFKQYLIKNGVPVK